jgi:hypothetical protein
MVLLYEEKKNTQYFLYNDKYYIKVDIVEYNKHHILTIYNYKQKDDQPMILANVVDIMHDNYLIRSFESGKSLTYVQYGENHRLINLEYEKKVKFIDKKVKEFNRKDK